MGLVGFRDLTLDLKSPLGIYRVNGRQFSIECYMGLYKVYSIRVHRYHGT